MTLELTVLMWTLVLALIQIGLPSILRTRQYGTDWNVSARDAATPPPWPVTARLERAERNLFENLPLFTIAVLVANVAHRESQWTAVGACVFLAARIAYVPLYAFGVKYVRTLVFLISHAGLLAIVGSVLAPG